MNKILMGCIILILIVGNIYFYLKSEKKIAPLKVMGTASSTITTTKVNNTSTYKYATPSFELNAEMAKVTTNMQQIKAYALKNKCNKDYAFIIDMRIPSYKKRFFVYNIKNNLLITSGFVAHGTGSETFKSELIFSNIPDSRCTSLGKYKISSSYNGMYGFSYRLIGLDSTNNNALKRAIVLHGHSCVPDIETDEYPICFSYGCPMVSTKFLKTLKGYISKQGKTPILLSIIY